MKKRILWGIGTLIVGVITLLIFILNNTNTNIKVTILDENNVFIKEVEVKKDTSVKDIEKPVKTGYVFKNWQKDGNIIKDDEVLKEDTTLIAIYELEYKVAEYVVTFNTDGGSTIESVYVIEGNTISEPSIPTKTGYLFKYWELDGIQYDFALPVSKSITLKAVWQEYDEEKEKTYTIKFDTNGGTKINSQIVKENEKVTKPSIPTKSGYEFVEWQYNGKVYNFNSKVTKNITIKAIWKESTIKKYVVTFDTDGGNTIANQFVKENEKVTRPNNPTKEGYTFVEWQLNGNAYDFNSKVTSAIILKAVWRKSEASATTYRVLFNSNGGSTIETQNVESGKKVTKPSNPTRTGYTFIEWKSNGVTYNFDTPVTQNITLHAQWKKNSYIVTFDGNGGIPSFTSKTIEYLDTYGELPTATRDGYDFLGWSIQKTGGTILHENTLIQKLEDHILYAQWETAKCTITYDANGGLNTNGQILGTQKIDCGSKTTKPGNPTRSGYTFVGWYKDNNLYDFNSVVSENITLIAKYIKDPTLSYFANGFNYYQNTYNFSVNSDDYTNLSINWTLFEGIESTKKDCPSDLLYYNNKCWGIPASASISNHINYELTYGKTSYFMTRLSMQTDEGIVYSNYSNEITINSKLKTPGLYYYDFGVEKDIHYYEVSIDYLSYEINLDPDKNILTGWELYVTSDNASGDEMYIGGKGYFIHSNNGKDEVTMVMVDSGDTHYYRARVYIDLPSQYGGKRVYSDWSEILRLNY